MPEREGFPIICSWLPKPIFAMPSRRLHWCVIRTRHWRRANIWPSQNFDGIFQHRWLVVKFLSFFLSFWTNSWNLIFLRFIKGHLWTSFVAYFTPYGMRRQITSTHLWEKHQMMVTISKEMILTGSSCISGSRLWCISAYFFWLFCWYLSSSIQFIHYFLAHSGHNMFTPVLDLKMCFKPPKVSTVCFC